MGVTVDPYDVMKLKSTADSTEISQAYHNLARQLHPDKNNAPNAKEVFQQLHQAYRVLSDPDERSKLDNQRAAKEREQQRIQQAREIQLKYQQQLIEQRAREKAFLFQEQQQKIAREQAIQQQRKLNEMNKNPREINQEIICDPHHDATAKWLLEQFGIQPNKQCNNSNLRVDSVKKRSKSPCNLSHGSQRSPSPHVQINVQPRTNNVHSMNNMHNGNNMQNGNNMHNGNNMQNGNNIYNGNNMQNGNNMHNMNNMNSTNGMNRGNSFKLQQRPPPGNTYNQQQPSQVIGQGGYQHIRVDSMNRRPRPMPKTPPDVMLREQSRGNSMVFDLSSLEAQLLDGICNNPDPKKSPIYQTQTPQQQPKVMLIKVVSNPLVH